MKNEILKIPSAALPDTRMPQLPIRIDFVHPERNYPPEFWLVVPTDKQQALIEEFEKHGMEYIIYEVSDSSPKKSVAVCRWTSYQDTERKVIEICKTLFIDDFVVSAGGLSSVAVNGDLQGFFCFD
ncbi:MAG: hypothetical protein K2I69_02925 [Muribaculaceae bacterium]|nr:hypothetical protein [Muribaculaceae bacterium]